jgi:hypothetical protein
VEDIGFIGLIVKLYGLITTFVEAFEVKILEDLTSLVKQV